MSGDRTSPRVGAIFAVGMLIGTGRGRTYTEGEYGAWLAEAGFTGVRRVALPGPNDLLVAERPSTPLRYARGERRDLSRSP